MNFYLKSKISNESVIKYKLYSSKMYTVILGKLLAFFSHTKKFLNKYNNAQNDNSDESGETNLTPIGLL